MTAVTLTAPVTVSEAHAAFHVAAGHATRVPASEGVQSAMVDLGTALARHGRLSLAACPQQAAELSDAAVSVSAAAGALITALAADGHIDDLDNDAAGVTA